MRKGLLYVSVVVVGLLVGYAMHLLEETAVRPWVIITIAAVSGIGLALLVFLRMQAAERPLYLKVLGALSGLILGGLAVSSLCVITNALTARAFRGGREQVVVTRVAKERRTYTRTGRRGLPRGSSTYTTYAVHARTRQGDKIYMHASASDYKSINKGDTIRVYCNRGLLGWRFSEL